jgi:hypothetical protein
MYLPEPTVWTVHDISLVDDRSAFGGSSARSNRTRATGPPAGLEIAQPADSPLGGRRLAEPGEERGRHVDQVALLIVGQQGEQRLHRGLPSREHLAGRTVTCRRQVQRRRPLVGTAPPLEEAGGGQAVRQAHRARVREADDARQSVDRAARAAPVERYQRLGCRAARARPGSRGEPVREDEPERAEEIRVARRYMRASYISDRAGWCVRGGCAGAVNCGIEGGGFGPPPRVVDVGSDRLGGSSDHFVPSEGTK